MTALVPIAYLKPHLCLNFSNLHTPSMDFDIPSLPSPCVRANPDISGVGIRLSIYLQAFLNVACALIFSPNATISDFEHSILSTSSRNLFLTGGSLLICAFYQGSIQGLTVHHTLIVLNLNWIILKFNDGAPLVGLGPIGRHTEDIAEGLRSFTELRR